MNKVYRVVWNAGAGKWVVASELTKGRKKKDTHNALTCAVTIALASFISPGATYAADTTTSCVTPEQQLGTVSIDGMCVANAGTIKTSRGMGVIGGTNGGIGTLATLDDAYVKVLRGSNPANASATGIGSMAIGGAANANGNVATAIGYLSNATAIAALAVGDQTSASGDYSTGLGFRANAAGADAVALGANASVAESVQNAVALGQGSVADRSNTVSVGSDVSGSAFNRQIVNVGAGTQANDAVNVSQFSPVVSALGGGASINSATGVVTGPTYNVQGGTQTNVGAALTALDTGLNITNQQVDTNTTNIAGNTANINNLLVGTAGLVQQANAAAPITIAAGNGGTVVNMAGTAGNRQITGVANGSLSGTSTDAVNGSQLNATNQQMATNTTNIAGNTTNINDLLNGTAGLVQQANATAPVTVAANNGGTVVNIAGTAGNRKISGVADGTQDGDAVNYGQLQALQGQVGDIGTLAVMYDDTSKGSITLGGSGATAPVAVHNVANGALSDTSTDAVNGSQLNTTNKQVATNTTNIAGNTTNINSLLNGTAGLVQQANTTAPITVAANNGGTIVNIAGTAGSRQISGVADGTQDDDAVNFSQLKGLQGQVGDIGALAVMYDDTSKGSITLGGVGATAPVLVHNVANGALSDTSTDAVNGSQLNATNQQVAANTTNIAGNTTHINNLLNGTEGLVQQANPTAPITVAANNGGTVVNIAGTDGNRQISGVADGTQHDDAVNYGQLQALQGQVGDIGALAVMYDDTSKSSITLGGVGATARVAIHNLADGSSTNDAVNFGQLSGLQNELQNQIVGINTQIGGLDSRVTILENETRTPPYLDGQGGNGQNNNANAGDTPGVALGYNAVATGNNAAAVGQNAQALGEHGTAVGSDAYAAGTNDTALGGNAKVHADGSVAVGANANVASSATNAVAVGADSSVNAASGTAIGQGATVASTATNAVAIGTGAQATQANSVSMGSVGNERTVTNVAAGVNGTDAVNVNQLKATQSWAQSYIDQQSDALNNRISRMTQRANAGTAAAAMAMTNIPQAYAPNQSSLGAGVGNFSGEAAIAVGLSAITPSGRWVVKVSITGNTRGDAGAGFGAAMIW